MKLSTKIFLGMIGIELILVLVFGVLLRNECGSFCDTYSYLNPFGLNKLETIKDPVCITACIETPHSAYYFMCDLLVLTVASYLVFSFYTKVKGGLEEYA